MDSKKLNFPPQMFITGTDTDVGKTVVSALLTLGLQGHYWKPIQCGLEPCSDRECVKKHTQMNEKHFHPEAYIFNNPLSPNQAAKLENRIIDLNTIQLPICQKPLIIEGAGGILVPLNEHQTQLDLIKQLNVPVILVARSGLGTLNHTLMSLHVLRERNIPLFGIILNGPQNQANKETLEQFGKVPIIAQLEPLASITPESLLQQFNNSFGVFIEKR